MKTLSETPPCPGPWPDLSIQRQREDHAAWLHASHFARRRPATPEMLRITVGQLEHPEFWGSKHQNAWLSYVPPRSAAQEGCLMYLPTSGDLRGDIQVLLRVSYDHAVSSGRRGPRLTRPRSKLCMAEAVARWRTPAPNYLEFADWLDGFTEITPVNRERLLAGICEDLPGPAALPYLPPT